MAVKKKSRHFGFEATLIASLYSESLLFGRPGFDSRQLQTLRAHNFVALGPTGSKTTFFERSDLCLLGNRKKIGFAGLLRVLLIGQSTIKLYHKKQIDPERLAPTVCLQFSLKHWLKSVFAKSNTKFRSFLVQFSF